MNVSDGFRIKARIVIATIFLLILALGFSTMLSSSSLEKLYINSLVSGYEVVGKDFKLKLEKSLRFGKNIKKFVGMDVMMDDTLKHIAKKTVSTDNEFKRYVAVALPDGKILYSSKKMTDSYLPKEVNLLLAKDSQKKISSDFVKCKSTYYVVFPIRNRDASQVATFIMTFGEQQIKKLRYKAIIQNLKIGGLSLGCGILLLIIILHFTLPAGQSTFPKRKILVILFTIIILCQLVFSYFGANNFRSSYLNINRGKAITINEILKEKIEYLLSKGLGFKRLYKMEVMMGEILAGMPELSNMAVVNQDGKVFYLADQSGAFNFVRGKLKGTKINVADVIIAQEFNISTNFYKGEEVIGRISTNISRDLVLAKLRDNLYDAITILVISILFSVELLIILFQFLNKKKDNEEITSAYGLIRPVAFLFLFAVALSVSFLPLHMASLYKPMFGLSKDIVLGLPISVEMLCVLIVLFPSAGWMDRRGWHEPFFVGGFIAVIGLFLSGIATGPLEFIFYRGIMGAGYGFSWIALQGFVVSNCTANERATGMSTLVAGIFAGSICGSAVGAMLAERIGYRPVFFIAAGIMVFSLFFTLLFLKNYFIKPKVPASGPQKHVKGAFFKIMLNRNIFFTFIFSIIPTSICVVGVLYYMSPIYLNRIGTTQSNIGRAFMVYGLCMIYIAPLISRLVDKTANKRIFIVISGLCSGLGLIVFYYFNGFFTMLFMIFMLGIASSFGTASQLVFVLDLKISNEIGLGKVMSFQRTADKIGQMMGPIIFGLVAGIVGVESGIAATGFIYLLFTLLLIVGTKQEYTINNKDQMVIERDALDWDNEV